jgi:hypothetical protein
MTQDASILAPPRSPTPQSLEAFQSSFRSLNLAWGVAPGEFEAATNPSAPFQMQLTPLPPRGTGGLLVFGRGESIPDNSKVPDLWPQVVLLKLAEDPLRRADPQALVVQGTPEESNVTGAPPKPLVMIQAITLLDDSLVRTIAGPVPSAPGAAALRDHVRALVRPAALCFDPRRVDVGGLLVAPHLKARSADASELGEQDVFDTSLLSKQTFVREIRRGCLPKGRYAMTLVYPTGQTWTVPNEIGGCAPSEGALVSRGDLSTCADKPRSVLLSQGARAVLEIVDAADPSICEANPVPLPCLKL